MNIRAFALGPRGFGVYDVSWTGGRLAMERVEGAADCVLIPGFVDIHIHGAFGIDFMSASLDEMQALCKHLEGEGYEGFLPTTVTADAASVRRALANLPDDPM